MSGVELKDMIAEGFEKQGYIVFTRKNHCDILAVKPDMALAYLIECKDYELSRKQQSLAVRELNQNYTYALELLKDHRLYPEKILRVLIAQAFSHHSRGILQCTPAEFLEHIGPVR
jgi:uncharacterized protein YjbK